jgi:hypothetical protein
MDEPDRQEMTAVVHLVGVPEREREAVAVMLSGFLLRALYYVRGDGESVRYTISVDGRVHKEGGR